MTIRGFLCILTLAIAVVPFGPAFGLELGEQLYGVYAIGGEQSVFGKYAGELEVRPGSNGRITVNRIITYRDFHFEGFLVQEVWSGEGQVIKGELVANFELKQADIFAQVDAVQRTALQFRNPISLPYKLNDTQDQLRLQTPVGTYLETVQGKARPLSATALWMNERHSLQSFGQNDPLVNRIAISTLFAPFIAEFHKDPIVASYLSQPRCQNQTNQEIQDQTDFKFLRAHPDTIRIDNKLTDQISLIEASIKRDAFGPTLIQKQAFIDQDIPNHHLNQIGQYAASISNADGRFKGFAPDGDASLYTGMYAASQAMRYLVTHEPEALAGFKTATKSLMLLMDLTGNKKTFARTAQLIPPSGVDPGWNQGVAPNEAVEYLPGGNNDMVQGIFLALSFAYEILPADDSFLAQVNEHAQRLPELSVNGLKGTENFMLAHGLAALGSKSEKELLLFTGAYLLMMKPADALSLDTGFYYAGIADWSGSNLIGVSKIARIIIAKNIATRFKAIDSLGMATRILREARQTLLDVWTIFEGSKRDAITVAAEVFGRKGALPGMPNGLAPRVWGRQALFSQSVAQTIWSLNEVPVPRSRHKIVIDFTLNPEWCMSYWPRYPWKSFSSTHNRANYYYQSSTNYPFYELDFVNTDDFNKENFAYQKSGDLNAVQYGRVDFLFLYWMSRLGELLSPAS